MWLLAGRWWFGILWTRIEIRGAMPRRGETAPLVTLRAHSNRCATEGARVSLPVWACLRWWAATWEASYFNPGRLDLTNWFVGSLLCFPIGHFVKPDTGRRQGRLAPYGIGNLFRDHDCGGIGVAGGDLRYQ